jgi:DNA-binding MarR family transcriptional regulator
MAVQAQTQSRCACIRARRASRSLTGLYDEALRPVRLKITQFSALRNVQRLEPVSISRLAEEMALERSTLGRNLLLLRRRGLLRFADADDRREWSIELTPKARELLGRALPLWERAQARVEAALGKEGVATLFGLLEKLEQAS